MKNLPPAWSDANLDRMQFAADPLADRAIAAVVGDWHDTASHASAHRLLDANAPQWQRLAAVNPLFETWKDNASLIDWRAPEGTLPEVAQAVQDYLRDAPGLPSWADPARIALAERLFMDYGVLSCTLLFCASLPQCYVIPDLSLTLHATGRLEHHTEYRIRATAAMIFPVMMQGGLTRPDGGGRAQVLKVRLIHAAIRHLILRATPEQALQRYGAARRGRGEAVIPPVASLQGARGMHQALFALGWDVGKDGLPCNQEELAYTLLTFGYVFLQGLRRLGQGLGEAGEDAVLHTWNVMAHLLGVRDDLMAHTMDDAAALFERIQARGRADPLDPDPRPHLGRALMDTMEGVIPIPIAKPVPRLLTRYLCGRATARDIGIDGGVPWPSRLLFWLLVGLIRGIDAVARLFAPRFSIARLVTRVVGRRLMEALLMDQTRPLKLPERILPRARAAMLGWRHDPKAPQWMNALESRLCTRRDGAQPHDNTARPST